MLCGIRRNCPVHVLIRFFLRKIINTLLFTKVVSTNTNHLIQTGMDSSIFIYSAQNLEIERFHLCSWEFQNESCLLEIGCEISAENLTNNDGIIDVDIYIPWLSSRNTLVDLFPKLKEIYNSKFIFNDSIIHTHTFDGGRGVLGILHEFQNRPALCILPITIEPEYERHKIRIKLDLSSY